MISPIIDLNYRSPEFVRQKTIAPCSSIYEVAYAIFRVIAMALQYIVVKASVTFRHWRWFPSALPEENLKVASRNIANLSVMQKCLSTAWCPCSKSMYQEIGRAQGLRITSDLIFHPASGLCLGKSFIFLSEYFASEEIEDIDKLVAAAQAVEGDENERSVELQAIYDSLIGIQGTVESNERNFFLKCIQGKRLPLQETSHPELLASIETFLSIEDCSDPFREFVLDDLEEKGVEITVDLYALILELDTLWYLQQHPDVKKNDSTHDAIIQAVAHYLRLESMESVRLIGNISSVRDQLENFEIGSYFIQFPNHTLAFVKGEDHIALFEPNEGLAIFERMDQQEGLSQLLEYYGNCDKVSLKVIAIHDLSEK